MCGDGRSSGLGCSGRGSSRHSSSRWAFDLGFGRLFRCSSKLELRNALQLAPNFVGHVDGNRAGVGFLFAYAKTGQKVDDGLGFDLELARQFVNSDLRWIAHASLRIFLFLLSLGTFFRRFSGRRVCLGGGFRSGCSRRVSFFSGWIRRVIFRGRFTRDF
jgi:hypothetical protein